ncbi:single-stranded DNA-binding protein [Salibacterium lacus]|uniref:Single-stranded DNA-binding protein n=1 Tax=Salibacterium lacus TaxID=1898109 RepID=A0ABW5SYX0_9BACI
MPGVRDQLKKREEKREQAANGGDNGNLPEGVTRYVSQAQELKGDGKPFVILRDPDLWYFYFVHEAASWSPREVYVQKHTCLNSPTKAPETPEEAEQLFEKYGKPNGSACISDKAKAPRKLYLMIPVFDPEYNEWRVIDFKEYHVGNVIADFDKAEKGARKFQKDYSLIGDVCVIKKSADGKSYTLETYDGDDGEEIAQKASEFMDVDIPYEELANFREESDMIEILRNADDNYVDKSVLPEGSGESSAEAGDSDGPAADAEDPTEDF